MQVKTWNHLVDVINHLSHELKKIPDPPLKLLTIDEYNSYRFDRRSNPLRKHIP